MSITSAFRTGVAGLRANSHAVGNTAQNIANANTVGYRRSFTQMVTTMASGGGRSGTSSVRAVGALDMNRSGGLFATNSPTDLAITGRGFFAVSANPGETVQSNFMLTRAGSFLPDENGNLVNSAGYYLSGFPYRPDGTVGDVDRNSFKQMKTVNIGHLTRSASATTQVSVFGNLPAQKTGQATPGDPFTSSSEFFTSLGESQRIGLSWQPTANPNEWDLTFSDPDGTPMGSVTVTFEDSGTLAGTPASYSNVTSLVAPPAQFSFDTATGQASLGLDNGSTPQVVTIDLGAPGTFDGVTQFAGDFAQTFDHDGSSTGELTRTEIDTNGTLFGVFSNGERVALYDIPLVVVDNPNGLNQESGNAFSLSSDSGNFFALTAQSGGAGAINSGALEGSNVDIAQELTDLIKTQRAYSTNAKVVMTADEMTDETTRLKR